MSGNTVAALKIRATILASDAVIRSVLSLYSEQSSTFTLKMEEARFSETLTPMRYFEKNLLGVYVHNFPSWSIINS